MLDVFNTSQPTGCNIQTFYGNTGTLAAQVSNFSWTKPRGVSHVYIMLIGGGGAGNGGTAGGGTGAVTVWYGAAQNVPDLLRVNPARSGAASVVNTFNSGTLLTAAGSATSTGGAAATANTFANSGFFQSVAGQTGQNGTNPSASATTFLGAGSRAQDVFTANYGYQITAAPANGFFQLQPIIVGIGSGSGLNNRAVGCGAGDATFGGPGLVLIASW